MLYLGCLAGKLKILTWANLGTLMTLSRTCITSQPGYPTVALILISDWTLTIFSNGIRTVFSPRLDSSIFDSEFLKRPSESSTTRNMTKSCDTSISTNRRPSFECSNVASMEAAAGIIPNLARWFSSIDFVFDFWRESNSILYAWFWLVNLRMVSCCNFSRFSSCLTISSGENNSYSP